MNRHLRAYTSQKNSAATRGIEFKLTFEEWLAWWGDDIGRRGTSKHCLSMQRLGDKGAYELGNIKKGTPRKNMVTMGLVKRTDNGLSNAAEHQAAIDRMMFEESSEPEPELSDDEQELSALGISSSYERRYTFAADY